MKLKMECALVIIKKSGETSSQYHYLDIKELSRIYTTKENKLFYYLERTKKDKPNITSETKGQVKFYLKDQVIPYLSSKLGVDITL